MWRYIALFLSCVLMAFGTVNKVPTVFLIGDSTCAIKSADAFPEMGWGVPFVTFFDSVSVENHAKNGRSTRSFMEEGRWTAVKSELRSGDYVFIQFGHNDEVPSKVGRYTTPDQFKANLSIYVNETRASGAFPVLLTPVTRRSFDEQGVLVDSHEEYAQLVRDVADSLDVPLIDMTKKSMKLVAELGEEKSELLYHHLAAGEHPNYPNGKSDDTHFNELGARKMAQLVLDGMEELHLELCQHIVKGKR